MNSLQSQTCRVEKTNGNPTSNNQLYQGISKTSHSEKSSGAIDYCTFLFILHFAMRPPGAHFKFE